MWRALNRQAAGLGSLLANCNHKWRLPAGWPTDAFKSTMSTIPSTAGKRTKRAVPEGLWIRCPGCTASIYRKEAEKLLTVSNGNLRNVLGHLGSGRE